MDSTGAPTWNSPIAGNTNNITIGSGYGLNYTNGSMYTFRLYNRSLSPDEVLHNYLYDRWRYAGKVLPAIIWSNPTNIPSGSALSSTQLNAVATDPETGNSVPGSFVYTPASGTVLSAGTHTLHVDFTPTDAANYTNASRDVTINVTSGPITDGLVVYYDGNLSGNSLLDLSGNSNTGYARSVTSGTNQSTGAGYISLNGVNSRINVSNNAQTNVSGSMSVEFIGSINTFRRYGSLVSKYSSGPLGWYLSCSPIDPYNNARFSAVLESGQKGYNSNISLVAGQVYDIVATYDNNTTHIYVNGVDSADPRIWNSPTAGSNLNITIGSGYGLNYTNCSMYSFRLYNRSLSQEEVLQNYNNDLWRYAPGETPAITRSNSDNITYGTAVNSTQLNAVATDPATGNGVTGNVVYTPAPDPVTNGLVVYYDGNLSGNSLVDLSGNSNTGYSTSVTSGTNQSTGAGYISLNGVNSRINVSNNAQTNVSSPITVEFMGSINTFSRYGSLVSKYSSGPLGWYLSCSPIDPYNNARFSAVLESGQKGYNSNISLVAGQVYDIVATYDNNTTHIYVNGVDSADPRIWNSPTAGSNLNITIGSGYGLNYTNCSMYTFRLYNRALSQEEVLQNYNYDRWRCTTTVLPTIIWSNPANITYGTALTALS